MKSFGYFFNVGKDADNYGVIFARNKKNASRKLRKEIANAYLRNNKQKTYWKAIDSLKVYDLA